MPARTASEPRSQISQRCPAAAHPSLRSQKSLVHVSQRRKLPGAAIDGFRSGKDEVNQGDSAVLICTMLWMLQMLTLAMKAALVASIMVVVCCVWATLSNRRRGERGRASLTSTEF
jgi:hypothetical protein